MNKRFSDREVIVSQIFPDSMIGELSKYDIFVNKIEPSKNLQSELRYHPDILTFKLPDGSWLNEENSIKLREKCPDDCVYNCMTVGSTLVYGNSYIADKYEQLFNKIIKVKQYYVKCSSIVLNSTAIITSDVSIYRALNREFDVLLVTNSGISLNGYNCGFIGGCSGVVDNKVLFTGNIKLHEDYENIKAFAKNYGCELISLSNATLYDYGGIMLK